MSQVSVVFHDEFVHVVQCYSIKCTKRITSIMFQLSQSYLLQAPVGQKQDNAIHRINHYPADGVVCFVNIYPLDSDLSGG